MFNLSVLDPKFNEGGRSKKHLRKKNIKPIFGKVNKGHKIKKTLDKFLEKLM